MSKARAKKALTVERENKTSYTVDFIDDMFAQGNEELANILRNITGAKEPKVLIVADANVVQRTEGLGKKIGKYFQDFGIKLAANPVISGGGEKVKSDALQSASSLLTAALEAKIGTKDVVLAIGGGALLDLAGYVASQVRGGVNLVRVPTTPAAMVDGAFSDVASLDYNSVKDALRVPSTHKSVIIDVSFAATVLDGVWRGGFGAMVRHAAALDSSLMKKLAKNVEKIKNRDLEAMKECILATAESRIKKGHTSFALWCANRLESMSGYKLPHGYAVPIGICIDCAYAVQKGIMKESDQELICRTLADGGALDGLSHSHHLLNQVDNILYGLDAWRLSTGIEAVTIPSGVGKMFVEEAPDRESYKKVIKEFLAVSSGT